MLSNVEMVLLSLVNEKPSYAYEIDKEIQARDMRRWVKVGVASIYQVLERLGNKGYLYSEREQEGKMPPRNRYFLTQTGRDALREATKNRLAKLEWFYLDLNLGLESGDCLDTTELITCLRARRENALRNLSSLTRLQTVNRKSGYDKKKAVTTVLYGLRQAEISAVDQLLTILEHDTT